ncbi:hypothetical protein [Thalassiella azotivora]
MTRHATGVVALGLVLAACGAEGDGAPAPTETTTTVTATPTGTPTTTPTQDGPELTRCDNPEGFSIAYPEDWSTNSGDVVAACSQFHPEPFDVPAGTDERVAAVVAYVDPVPFDVATDPGAATDVDRTPTTVDGRQAVRLEYTATGDALWPAGTPVTLYAVDLTTESQDRTLFLTTVGTPDMQYEQNQDVLDRMVGTLELDG